MMSTGREEGRKSKLKLCTDVDPQKRNGRVKNGMCEPSLTQKKITCIHTVSMAYFVHLNFITPVGPKQKPNET